MKGLGDMLPSPHYRMGTINDQSLCHRGVEYIFILGCSYGAALFDCSELWF